MRERQIAFPGRGPGTTHSLTVLEFGLPGARPHVHVQGGLHADEAPGMLAARLLADRLTGAEAEGRLRGRVTVIPAANPPGLGQFVNGDQTGRFDLYDGRNFNRDYPDLTDAAAGLLAGRLGPDPAVNAILIREALALALHGLQPRDPADALRHHLMRAALPADAVLDLHCDGEAEVHLYTQGSSLPRLEALAAHLGCKAVLLADVSGGQPFDEALARPWAALAARFPEAAVPQGCASCTVELRGRSDVSRDLAAQDAGAILAFLGDLGVLAGPVPARPPACLPTPLAGSEALMAPVAGLLSYVAQLGATVAEGDTVAEITDPLTGRVTPVRAGTSGVFYARPATRIAEAGKRLGKIAGREPFRDGPLLSP
jgi:hypothetical protein